MTMDQHTKELIAYAALSLWTEGSLTDWEPDPKDLPRDQLEEFCTTHQEEIERVADRILDLVIGEVGRGGY